MRSYSKFGPDLFSRFWIQTDRQTDKQIIFFKDKDKIIDRMFRKPAGRVLEKDPLLIGKQCSISEISSIRYVPSGIIMPLSNEISRIENFQV